MKRLLIGATMLALLTGPVAIAQPDNPRAQRSGNQQREDRQWHEQSGRRDNDRNPGWGRDRGTNAHWGRGQQMGYNDWRNARRIDYRRYNLRQPPRGYEWRGNDDRFFLAGISNGMIISVVLGNDRNRGWGRDRGTNARWGRGQQMGYNDWRNARKIDYRRHNLRQPPRGYEWRRNDDRYVLAAISNGMIISVILSNGR